MIPNWPRYNLLKKIRFNVVINGQFWILSHLVIPLVYHFLDILWILYLPKSTEVQLQTFVNYYLEFLWCEPNVTRYMSLFTKSICINSWKIWKGTSPAPRCNTDYLPIVSHQHNQWSSRITLWDAWYMTISQTLCIKLFCSGSYKWITWQVSIPPDRKPAHIICGVTDPE